MKTYQRLLGVFIGSALIAPALVGCNTKVKEEGKASVEVSVCAEFTANGEIKGDVNAEVRLFMGAANDFRAVGDEMRASVKTACANIAKDLGSTATFGDDDAAISNDAGTGACDIAAVKIKGILQAQAAANFAFSVSRGSCHVDYEQQKTCDQECKEVESCEPGTVEERCEAGGVAADCAGKCKPGATCEGKSDKPANCMGKCESECQGECKGTCTAKDGKKTENDPNCRGKCGAACNGTCRGLCKVDQAEAATGVDCGPAVKCKGACDGTTSAPVCETRCKAPPKCTVDTQCHETCTTRVEAKRVCEPTRIELYADATVNVEVAKLVATLEANLPVLLDAAQVKGKLVLDSANRLVVIGKATADAQGEADSKSLSCAAAGAKVAGEAAAHLSVAVRGGVAVSAACGVTTE